MSTNRGRPQIDDPRNKGYRLRLTEYEFAQLGELASKLGLTKAEFLRMTLHDYIRNEWIFCTEAMPADFGEDWVLVQIQERDTGFLWIPRVGEFRKHTNSWWILDEDISDMAKWPSFEVIAWHVIPAFSTRKKSTYDC